MISIPQLIISIVLFLVLFFGIGFILNMLLRSTWVMAVIYPIVVIFIIDSVGFFTYFTSPGMAFSELGQSFVNLKLADIIVLSAGMAGAILSGITIRMLRERGYQMF
ncbi:YuiB family protein [Alteribacter keqinensis]|uniref:Uncharacterized protein n=1 Tax=Alteribacter keqinensis TaxID=2483800 RepID=A0A3M7TST1_9BACI|nr:YuiB family protein [Alteribacter keqinensis]RNA67393.1 hypothetical protein EBO34_11675 [Alteribacter keqinensis]